jgi:hypothetical protein
MFKFIFFLFSIGISGFYFGQSGCTDPQAQNYNPAAVINDGSCVYAITNFSPVLITDLPANLAENSGMTFLNNLIYSINDGGNATILNELSQNGSLIRDIHIDSAQNVDWEAITASETELFIGDFGNNSGTRTNLKIYRINKNDVIQNDTVNSTFIQFYYPDQTNFNTQLNNNNFDCEAFIYFQDSLHLFTKGWANLYTKHYIVPLNNTEPVAAILKDSLFVDGLITDASIDSQSGNLVLLGYKNNGSNFYTSFVYLLFDFPNNQFFEGNKRRIEIGNMLTLSQTEGIAWKNQFSGFISSEQITSSFLTIQPKLFEFDFNSYLVNDTLGLFALQDPKILIYPNPTNSYVNVEIEGDLVSSDCKVFIENSLGQIVFTSSVTKPKFSIELATKNEKGIYFIRVVDFHNGTLKTQKFVLN